MTANAGEAIRANTAGSDFDTILVIWDAAGNLLAANDDSNGTLQSDLSFLVPEDGDYFVMVTGLPGAAGRPVRLGQWLGRRRRGIDYTSTITVGPVDRDFYAVRLKAGDVLGGNVKGAAPSLQVTKPDGEPGSVAQFADASFIYPPQSPASRCRRRGNTSFAYVAEEPGWYTVSTELGRR